MLPFGFDSTYLSFAPRAAELGPVLQIGLLALFLLVPAGLIAWLYRFELLLVRRLHALGLLGLRLLVLVFLWFVVALQPTLSHVAAEAVPSRVGVAVDISSSMDVADAQCSAEEAESLARAFGVTPTEAAAWSRKEIARRVLAPDGMDLLARLGQRHQLDLVAFHETRSSLDAAALDAVLRERDRVSAERATDLRQALVHGGTDTAPLHAILVLTDGRHNHGASPLGIARELGTLGVPIYPVAIGSRRPPPDLVLAEIQAPDKVFKDAVLPLTARIKAMHLPAQEFTVEVIVPGKPVRPEDRQRINHPGGDAVYEVKFQVPLMEAGTHALQVRATASKAGEITHANNERTHAVRVVEDKARVLVVDDEARWEYHYLAAALARDPTVRLERVLFTPPRLGLLKVEDPERAGLPRTQMPHAPAGAPDPLLDFDCIVLGDVAPERLPVTDRERLHRFVSERGGTLIVVAGKRAMPRGYMSRPDAANDPLVKLLPIRDPQILERKDGFALRLSEEGKRSPFLRLHPAASDGWPELPKHHWGITGARQPGATVLVTPDGETGKPALIVQHTYGMGKVIFLGLDSTWRWRYRVGDVYHHRFWGQLVRWAAADRLLPGGNRLVRYGSREPVYAPGQAIDLAARFTEDAALPQRPVRARVVERTIDGSDKVVAELPLEPNPQQKRLFEGKLRELPAGSYRMELDEAALPQAARDGAASAVFTVLAEAKGELLDLSTDWDLLQALADESGGRLFTAAEVSQIVDLLAQKVQPREIRQDSRAWQDDPVVWWTLGVLLGLLTLEWMWRKGLDLP